MVKVFGVCLRVCLSSLCVYLQNIIDFVSLVVCFCVYLPFLSSLVNILTFLCVYAYIFPVSIDTTVFSINDASNVHDTICYMVASG